MPKSILRNEVEEIFTYPGTLSALDHIVKHGFRIPESEAEAQAVKKVIDNCRAIVRDWGSHDPVADYWANRLLGKHGYLRK
jgi:hypothetical protein